jgi:hypothetical protein
MSKSDAQNKLDEYSAQKSASGGLSYSEAKQREERKGWEALIHRSNEGDPAARAEMAKLQDSPPFLKAMAMYNGKQTLGTQAMREADRMKNLGLNEAWDVYKVATPEERQVFAPFILQKYYQHQPGGIKQTDENTLYHLNEIKPKLAELERYAAGGR